MSHGWEGWPSDGPDPDDGPDDGVAGANPYADPPDVGVGAHHLPDPYDDDGRYDDEPLGVDDGRYDDDPPSPGDPPTPFAADPDDDQPDDDDDHTPAAGWAEPVGADPERVTGDDWPVPGFPEPLAFDALAEPVDGWPWADPDLLGAAPLGAATTPGDADPAHLAGYAAEEIPADADPWAALAASTDPATRALARFWAPAPQPDAGPAS